MMRQINRILRNFFEKSLWKKLLSVYLMIALVGIVVLLVIHDEKIINGFIFFMSLIGLLISIAELIHSVIDSERKDRKIKMILLSFYHHEAIKYENLIFEKYMGIIEEIEETLSKLYPKPVVEKILELDIDEAEMDKLLNDLDNANIDEKNKETLRSWLSLSKDNSEGVEEFEVVEEEEINILKEIIEKRRKKEDIIIKVLVVMEIIIFFSPLILLLTDFPLHSNISFVNNILTSFAFLIVILSLRVKEYYMDEAKKNMDLIKQSRESWLNEKRTINE